MELSFRDPDGQLLKIDNRVFRFVTAAGAAQLNLFLSSVSARRLISEGRVINSAMIDKSIRVEYLAKAGLEEHEPHFEDFIEHKRIDFPSFPYEWSAEMLYSAGELTLDLAEHISAEGFGLKDATPENILFEGPKPIFVDVLSFEMRDPEDPTWLPYAQFLRTFLLPLLANKYFNMPLSQVFLTNRDGLEPDRLFSMCSQLQRIRQPFLTLLSIPTWLNRGASNSAIYRSRRSTSPEQARFILANLFKRLRRQMSGLKPKVKKSSPWTDYARENHESSRDYVENKAAFVAEFMNRYQPKKVLDIGCNTGEFSKIAALAGAEVVAVDSDAEVINSIWLEAGKESLNILPLVVNFAHPSPATGWRNNEHASFLNRAGGYFDAVFMLAVVHHLLVTERIPLREIFDLAAELTTDHLIIEFIEPDDPMFVRIARGRDHLYNGLTLEVFENTCRKHFDIVRSEWTPRLSRRLYHLRKKDRTTAGR